MKKECKNCYGKGYSTEFVGETIAFGDFEGEQNRKIANPKVIVKLCSCERGKDLKKFFIIKK